MDQWYTHAKLLELVHTSVPEYSAMMSEAERQFYLQHAGVHLWYARAPLPGAAPSPDFDFGVEEPAPAGHDVGAPAVPKALADKPRQPVVDRERGKGRINQLQALMASPQDPGLAKSPAQEVPGTSPQPAVAPAETVSVERPADDDLAVDPQSSVSPSPGISRHCFKAWVGQRIVLMADLSEQSSLSLQETLALNILRSLGEREPDALGPVHWPLFNNLRVGLNAVDHLKTVVSEVLKLHADKVVVSLGDSAGVLPDALGKQPDVRFARGLAALAGDPSLKRELWQQIKSLSVGR
ncbi:MAG: 2-isopropylmalate synthase [Pseudomonadota bacterium]|nr:2-isopropylmalate synthase [Pseudomonadota bacterium]